MATKIATPPTQMGSQPGAPTKIATPPAGPEGSLATRVATAEADIAAAELAITAAQGDINTAEAAIDALEAKFVSGTGDPEGVVTAPVGTFYVDTAGGATAVLYVKAVGADANGWAIVTSVAS